MQNFLSKVYCYVDKYNLSDLSKLGRNINIIYRNYENIDHLKNLRNLKIFCKKNGNRLYLSNNIKLSIRLGLNGVYVPSFNNKLNYSRLFSLPKKFKIIGSAHNLKEIRIKHIQGCKEIFLSPLFRINKSKRFLGVVKFNLLTVRIKKNFIALGGINEKNYKNIKLLKAKGFASNSWVKKNGLKKL
ncbi:thiamine phosphate synthase [Candidatus Pelagibacter sp.]|nr:thiamine phosphate synthase [Candidatus Pelagibacter sp.]